MKDLLWPELTRFADLDIKGDNAAIGVGMTTLFVLKLRFINSLIHDE